jgi:hypothetical protein
MSYYGVSLIMNNHTDKDKKELSLTSYDLQVFDDDVIEVEGKVLYINPDTDGIDYKGFIAKAAQYLDMGSVLADIKTGVEYVVQVPLKYEKDLKKGELFMMKNKKSGNMWPTLMKKLENGKNQIVDPLPIKEQEFIQGNPFHDMAQGYQNLYMQQQIGELADQMRITYKAVERIEQGQMDDRIAKLLSGRDQIILAMGLPDDEDRRIALANGRSSIVTAQKQILQTFKRRVENFPELPEGEWAQLKLETLHKGTLQDCRKSFDEAQEYYELYLQATDMLAASYAIVGDMETAEKTYEISMAEMSQVDFRKIKTLDYLDDNNEDLFYHNAVHYIEAEKELCIEQAEEFEYIQIAVTGEQLLEELENVGEEEISEEETE